MTKENSTEKIGLGTNSFIVPWIVFIFSVSIILISLVSVIFPALISLSGESLIPNLAYAGPDKFELGIWSVPAIIVNIVVLGFTFLYFKNKSPKSISKIFNSLFRFEISKKVTYIVLSVLVISYVIATSSELGTEETWGDYEGVKQRAQTWTLESIPTSTENHVKYFLITTSMKIFGNYAVIPFIASIALVLVTFDITRKITQKRFAAIVAVIILLQSNLFLTYDTSVTYDNFWILFYLLSLYLIFRVWPLSPMFYLLAIPSKALTILFLPMSIYFILRSKISKKQKTIISVAMILVLVILASSISSRNISPELAVGKSEGFSANEFLTGFTSFAHQLRFDGLILMFILPLIVGLFITSRHQVKHAESLMVLISGILLIAPLVTGFSDQTNQPYRFVPLVVFFAIGVGVLLSKRTDS